MNPKIGIGLIGFLIVSFPLVVSLLPEDETPQSAPDRTSTEAAYSSSQEEHSNPKPQAPQKAKTAAAKSEAKQASTDQNEPPMLRWELMRELNYETGDVGNELKKLLTDTVRVPGFVVPLDLDAEQAREFLLVPTYGACIHVPPPPANQMILVKMQSGPAPRRENGPVWVYGRVSVIKSETSWGKVGFEMKARKTSSYTGGY
jgi:hypothetical protein